MRSDADRSVRSNTLPAVVAAVLVTAMLALMLSCASTPEPEPANTADNNEPPPPPPPPQRRLVLTIGIDSFADTEIPANLTCVADAELVAEALQQTDAGETAEVVSLSDDEATVVAIKQAIADLAARTTERFDDTVVVYVATHGAAVKLPSGPWSPISPMKAFLVAHDTQRANVLETGIGLEAFQPLWECEAERVVVILDAAFTGSARSVTGRTIDGGHVQHIVDEQTKAIANDEQPARALIFGADINDPIRIDPMGRSSFAVTLLEGIDGAGDQNGDGDVLLAELINFIFDRVQNPGDSPDVTPLSPIRVVADQSAGVGKLADCKAVGSGG